LIEDQLPALLPKLYDETTPKPELIRIMEMGPWRHKIDDGLEARRTAYETMYTLVSLLFHSKLKPLMISKVGHLPLQTWP
jgi:hypothetical protein